MWLSGGHPAFPDKANNDDAPMPFHHTSCCVTGVGLPGVCGLVRGSDQALAARAAWVVGALSFNEKVRPAWCGNGACMCHLMITAPCTYQVVRGGYITADVINALHDVGDSVCSSEMLQGIEDRVFSATFETWYVAEVDDNGGRGGLFAMRLHMPADTGLTG